MSKKIKYSIVVPVYNAQKTIKRCIDSIFNQSCKDYELILVDDGSKDSSLEICKNACIGVECVRIIQKENGGVSSARNLGMSVAKGEYITFVDSDDYLDSDYLDSFFEKNIYTDFSIQGYKVVGNKDQEVKKLSTTFDSIIDLLDFTEKYNVINSPWAKVYKKEIIDNNHIVFDERISYGEDHLFVLNYIYYINSFSISKSCGYNYVDNNEGSLTHKLVLSSSYFLYLSALNSIYSKIEKKFYDKKIEINKIYNYRMYYNYLNYIGLCCIYNGGKNEIFELKKCLVKSKIFTPSALERSERIKALLLLKLPSTLVTFLMRIYIKNT